MANGFMAHGFMAHGTWVDGRSTKVLVLVKSNIHGHVIAIPIVGGQFRLEHYFPPFTFIYSLVFLYFNLTFWQYTHIDLPKMLDTCKGVSVGHNQMYSNNNFIR